MKLVNTNCPNCGAAMLVDKVSGKCVCNSCGGTFILDDESTTRNINFEGTEEAGYQFEKGRQKAQAEAQSYSRASYTTTSTTVPKKRRTWLWVLGWLFIFPVPLTILVCRSKKMENKTKIIIIAVVWVLYLMIALLRGCSGAGETGNSSSSVANSNIKEISFTKASDIEMTVGDNPVHSNIRVSVRRQNEFSSSDVVFVSENPEVATITFANDANTVYLYYDITPVSAGETYVYAMSADGTVTSDRIHVIVNGLTEVESITIDDNCSLLLGESVRLNPTVLPDNAADKTVTWSSSDETVATVDSAGNIIGVGGGEAVITATTSNGLSATCNVTVDDSQRSFNLTISRIRDDDNNIGDEWSHTRQINGETASNGPFTVAIGDTLTFYVRASEDDDVPDVGEATVTHTVTEEDFANGFSVEVEVYATENGGRNSGKSAHFVTTFTFEI